jgi:transcriptional regulator with XRE-family HTH domain
MVIGDRLKAIRESKEMSQGDIERKTSLLRCYISRVENGHTVPSLETLEKLARAMDIHMYQLFYEGNQKPPVLKIPESETGWGSTGKDARTLERFRRLLKRTKPADQKILFFVATKMAQKTSRKKSKA